MQIHLGLTPRGNSKTTGGPLPYLSGGAPRRAGRTGYRVRAEARGSRPRLGKALLFCSAQAFRREACSLGGSRSDAALTLIGSEPEQTKKSLVVR